MPQRVDTEALRRVVAAQTTISASIDALMQSIGAIVGNALDEGNPQPINDLLKHMDDTPTGWSDALLANTAKAQESARFVDMPGYVQEQFRQHANAVQARQSEQHGRETDANRQAQQPHAATEAEQRASHEAAAHGQHPQDKSKK